MIKISNFELVESRLNNLGFFFIDKNIKEIYTDVNKKYNIIDNNGYKYFCCLKHIFANKFPNIVGNSNPYSFYNIQRWIINNRKTYTLLSNEFVSVKDPLKLKCENGHIFYRNWNQLKNGLSCRECRYENQRILQRRPRNGNTYLSYDDSVTLDWSSLNQHPPTYYSYKSGEIVHWDCHICHYKWDTSIVHRTKDKSGCPRCSNKMSKSERFISDFLKNNSINFIQEYTFKDCRDENPLPFDFYLPDYNCIIEYDGEQHYIPVIFSSSQKYDPIKRLEYTQLHDKIKNKYCLDHNISLYRISYKDNLSISLENIISKLKATIPTNHSLSHIRTKQTK